MGDWFWDLLNIFWVLILIGPYLEDAKFRLRKENRTEFQKANGQLLLHVTHLKLSNDLVTLTFTESDAAAKTSATINARHAPIYRVSEIHLCKCEWNIIIGKLLGQCEERKAKALFIMLLFRKFQIATVHKRRHKFFEIFDPLPPSSSLLLNNLY